MVNITHQLRGVMLVNNKWEVKGRSNDGDRYSHL